MKKLIACVSLIIWLQNYAYSEAHKNTFSLQDGFPVGSAAKDSIGKGHDDLPTEVTLDSHEVGDYLCKCFDANSNHGVKLVSTCNTLLKMSLKTLLFYL